MGGAGGGFIPFRQLGQYEDVETGLYYNRFRYYDCNTGGYISQDPIGLEGGLALYSYVHDSNTWVDILGLVKGKIHKHHSDPKFLGGNPNQQLTEMIDIDHIQLHKDMNIFLETKTKVVEGEIVSMRPKRGNSGTIIRANFTRKERLDALSEFYKNNKSKYSQVYDDFFKQHPNLKPRTKKKKIC